MSASPAQLAAVGRLTVVCLAQGMPAGLMAKFFVDAGAHVVKADRPGGDPFDAIHPAYGVWFADARHAAADDVTRLLNDADVCLVGGEDHPDAPAHHDASALATRHPRLVVVDIRALDPGRPDRVPAVELLVQAAIGMTADHRSGTPMMAASAPGCYGAAVLGLVGAFAALVERERSGWGQVVTTSLEQGIALVWSQLWMDAEPHHPAFEVVAPRDLQHLIFECADGGYLQFTYGVPGAVRKVYDILGLPTNADEKDPGAPRSDRGPRNYYGAYDELAPAVARFDRDDLLARLRNAGIPAEPVLHPGDSWDDEQTHALGAIVDRDGRRHVGSTMVHRDGVGGSTIRRPAPGRSSPTGDPPLRGLRILDFGTLVAGPYASTVLAALGATVTRVESVPARPSAATVRNAFAVNPNKRSMALDLKTPGGAEALRRICGDADVVQHNFRVGAAERLGLDPESLWASDPGLITLTTTAFGPTGPKAFDRGLDMVVAALTGHQWRAGGDHPTWYRAPVIDYVCGALGAVGVLMSYYERQVTGVAPAVETSLLGAALFLQQDLVQDDAGRLHGLPPLASDGLGTSPWERLYACGDGWVAVAARSDKQREGLLAAVGDTAVEVVAATFARHTVAEALALCRAHDVWATACEPDAWPRLVAGHAAGEARMVATLSDPTYGTVLGCFGELVSFSRSTPPPAGTAPASRGQHTRDVLASAGYRDDEIDVLVAQGVVA